MRIKKKKKLGEGMEIEENEEKMNKWESKNGSRRLV